MVFIILSQMTTSKSFGRVYDRLKDHVPDWARLLDLPTRSLKALIRDAGLSHQKAPRLKAIASRLKLDFGRVTLAPLTRMKDADATCYLTSLPGVGIKTAKCVLMYSLGRAVLPVDTHVWRVARRLRLIDESTPYPAVHEALEAVVAADRRYGFHVNAVSHGRSVCTALRPRCGRCVLRRLCPSTAS